MCMAPRLKRNGMWQIHDLSGFGEDSCCRILRDYKLSFCAQISSTLRMTIACCYVFGTQATCIRSFRCVLCICYWPAWCLALCISSPCCLLSLPPSSASFPLWLFPHQSLSLCKAHCEIESHPTHVRVRSIAAKSSLMKFVWSVAVNGMSLASYRLRSLLPLWTRDSLIKEISLISWYQTCVSNSCISS